MLTLRSPRGASLVELLVVLAILGIAAGAVTRIATHQQRHHARLAGRTLAEAQLREGGEVLGSALAGIAPAAGDIYEGGLRYSSIDFRSPLATAVLCATPADGSSEIDLVQLGASEPESRSAHRFDPGDQWIATGDSVWIYEAEADTAGGLDAWRGHMVLATAHAVRACAPHPEGPAMALRVTVTPRPADGLEPHAPVRVFRRARYALYAASDGRSYLGFSDCRPVVRTPPCSPLQPVAGPYLAGATASSAVRGGLTIEYLDAHGEPTDDRFAVAAITVHLRVNAAPLAQPLDTMSLRRTIALRNVPR